MNFTYLTAAESIARMIEGHFYRLETRLVNDSGEDLTLSSAALTISETGEDFTVCTALVISDDVPAVLDQPFYTLSVDLVFPDLLERTRDAFQWRLVLRSAEQSADGWTLQLHSHESLVRDHALETSRVFNSSTRLSTALGALLREAVPGAVLQLAMPDPLFLEGDETFEWELFGNAWAALQEICDFAGATVFYDQERFLVTTIPDAPSVPKYRLPTTHVIGTPRWTINRDDFATHVRVEMSNGVIGAANSTHSAPRKLFKESVPHAGTKRQADLRAQAVLARVLLQGETLDVDVAHALLHLRPRDTIALTLPGGDYHALIETLNLDLVTGSTSLALRALERQG